MYKFAVTSTIIQHVQQSNKSSSSGAVTAGTSTAEEDQTAAATSNNNASGGNSNVESKRVQARRGIHSATAGYWNAEKDGIWNFKFDASDKGIEVIVCVVWISIV